MAASNLLESDMECRRTFILAAVSTLCMSAHSQQPQAPYVRWVELQVSQDDVAALQAAGRANTTASIATEPGISALHSAVEKANPERMRVLEVYANAEAYRAHVQAAHFQNFVRDTQAMLRNRSVFDTTPVMLGAKPQVGPATSATHVRVAELEIDPHHLDAYKAAVTEEINDSIRLEPGVLAIYCVALKDRPSHLRFFEVYADESAYRRHIETPHFRKYVDITKSMILDRKLYEMEAPILAAKPH
jgi:quinol monooxygenase YgiN